MLLLLADVHVSLAIIGFLSVIQESELALIEVYLAYHRSRDMTWEDETCIGWSQYVGLSNDALHMPIREVSMTKRTASDMQMKKWAGSCPSCSCFGRSRALQETAEAVSTVLYSSTKFWIRLPNFLSSKIRMSKKTRAGIVEA